MKTESFILFNSTFILRSNNNNNNKILFSRCISAFLCIVLAFLHISSLCYFSIYQYLRYVSALLRISFCVNFSIYQCPRMYQHLHWSLLYISVILHTRYILALPCISSLYQLFYVPSSLYTICVPAPLYISSFAYCLCISVFALLHISFSGYHFFYQLFHVSGSLYIIWLLYQIFCISTFCIDFFTYQDLYVYLIWKTSAKI